MKRSRIICSIVTVCSILLNIGLIIILGISCIENKTSLNIAIKITHILIFAVCVGLYVFTRNKLLKRVNSLKIINMYCYMFMAVIVFVSRLVMVYVTKGDNVSIITGYSNGLGSYINYLLGILLKNNMYANVIINTVIVFLSGILIKKIMLNITNNDIVSTITAIIYILLPKSLINITNYLRYEYNVLVMLSAIYLFFNIIDSVKDLKNKTNRYIYNSVILGVLAALDIILGGPYIFFIATLALAATGATYVDIVHIHFSDKLKRKFEYKKKILMERIEKINISKLVVVLLIVFLISTLAFVINAVIMSRNVDGSYNAGIIDRVTSILNRSRNYYIVLITSALVFDIIVMILKIDIEIKMFVLKVMYVFSIILMPFITGTGYISCTFDTLLSLVIAINICNVCINRENKIKLLKEKN